MISVILSGGVGSRLWPLSRKSRPKQYIPLFEQRSLFQLCAERNAVLAGHTVVVGNIDNYQLSQRALEAAGIKPYTEIIEAAPRNTAAAIAFAAFAADAEDVLLVCPSDHIIQDQDAYIAAVQEAETLALDGYLVTFGIKPSRPETGYGYIEYANNNVISFREKPSYTHAGEFVQSGRFLWNSGMFCFKAGVYLEELCTYEPALFTAVLNAWSKRRGNMLPLKESMLIPAKSIDYAVMEQSGKIKVVPAAFGWSDLGSFESMWEYFEKEVQQHRFVHNNMVLGVDKHVEFVGVKDLVVVNTEDVLLILPKSASQDVKKVYERLEIEKPVLLS
ncbi:mannose-1-phosphate guanylyltransferase [Pedobacter sp. BS3]|uniref:mannose-1-phosphate guanylyltransferase n=1 Tax=Pedobacter sp. BS3 TaxID=2567937 RepID=UPI0011EDEC33|nr:sugar phosphate nucleotidyltransferase [Pedobacter sp. BS3]TZF84444.1 mannose-1-phosphate guanylyltransferase [Pedobacter sp. BS3]